MSVNYLVSWLIQQRSQVKLHLVHELWEYFAFHEYLLGRGGGLYTRKEYEKKLMYYYLDLYERDKTIKGLKWKDKKIMGAISPCRSH
jgi:hypothetical protein